MIKPTDDNPPRDLEFPALYKAADRASNEAQQAQLRFFYFNAGLLVAGSALATIFSDWPYSQVLGALVFVGSLACYLSGQIGESRRSWYQARALAESVKTATWRLVMNADPFSASEQHKNLKAFRSLLKELLKENESIGKLLSGNISSGEQVTVSMEELLALDYTEKRDIYCEQRIKNQKSWYAAKAEANKRASQRSCVAISIIYAVLATLMLVRIRNPNVFYPVSVLAVGASSLIAWTQLKRFDELASAYGLTAHEVGIIEANFSNVSDAKELANFVADAENAFSREHTQWAARRDH